MDSNKILFLAACFAALVISCLALPVSKQTQDSSLTSATEDNTDKASSSTEKELQDLVHPEGKVDELPAVPAEPSAEEAKEEVKSDEEEESKESVVTVDKQAVDEDMQKRSSLHEEYRYPQGEDSPLDQLNMKDEDLSPAAMAEYLFVSRDFDGLNILLNELLDAELVTEDEIQDYREAVRESYEALLAGLTEPQAVDSPLYDDSALPMNSQLDGMDVWPQMDIPSFNFGDQLRRTQRMQMENAIREENPLDSLISNLLADYYAEEPATNNNDLEALYDLVKDVFAKEGDLVEEADTEFSVPETEQEDSTEQELEELKESEPSVEATARPKVVEAQE